MEWSKTKKYNPNGPGYPEAGYWYVLQSEAEERISKLEAEVARLTQRKEFWKNEATCYRDDFESAVAARPNQLILIANRQRAEREVERLKDAIREHRDSFSKDMDEHDWTTEDEALWALVEEVRCE